MSEKMKNNLVLEVKGLTKKFGELVAINNISFDVREGEILGIIGPNGSGKTTLFNLLSGVLQPDNGAVYAKRIKSPSFIDYISSFIGSRFTIIILILILASILTDNFILWTLYSVLIFSIVAFFIYQTFLNKKSRINRDNYSEFGENLIGKRTDHIVRHFGLARTFQIVRPFKLMSTLDNAKIAHIPNNTFVKSSALNRAALSSLLEVDLGEKKNYPALILPHGDLKRLDFARTTATDSKIILLDEPFSGLSAEDSFRVTQLIKNANEDKNVTILLVEHKLRLLANLVSRIIVLDQGSVIADGTPEEVAQDKQVIASYLGEEASEIVRS